MIKVIIILEQTNGNNNTKIALTWALKGKGKEEDQNQQGEGLWKQGETNWEGVLGRWSKTQLEIVHNGGSYKWPYAPTIRYEENK